MRHTIETYHIDVYLYIRTHVNECGNNEPQAIIALCMVICSVCVCVHNDVHGIMAIIMKPLRPSHTHTHTDKYISLDCFVANFTTLNITCTTTPTPQNHINTRRISAQETNSDRK